LFFINNEDATLSNGKKGAGLSRYLRTLTSSNGDDRRNVIATVFNSVDSLGKQASLPRGAPPVTCVLDS
jgi:type I restriction enzyme M protein